ncbi:hypothetical protein [Tateyamaria sp.]|uniref:hypothetical protein n=2 Tax=Tateyamaria sp. TaxID=1929288 RepID=UPI00329EB6AE
MTGALRIKATDLSKMPLGRNAPAVLRGAIAGKRHPNRGKTAHVNHIAAADTETLKEKS